MRLLLNLITALNDEEAAKLPALKLRGKQLSVMDIVLTARQTGTEPTKAEIDRLELSDSHLYEISSVVLGKCHHLLVPEGGVKLLEFLTYKNAILQFKQEFRRQRKQIPNKRCKASSSVGFCFAERYATPSSSIRSQSMRLNEKR